MEHKIAPEHVYNAPVSTVGDNSPQAVVNDRTGFWIAILALVFGAASLGISAMTPALNQARSDSMQAEINALKEQVRLAEREARVATERTNAMMVQLAQRGIPTDDH